MVYLLTAVIHTLNNDHSRTREILKRVTDDKLAPNK